MAIRKMFQISIQVVGDGVSNSFSIDLAANPYLVMHYALPFTSELVNWFTDKTSAVPTSIDADRTYSDYHGTVNVTLLNKVLTITYPDTIVAARNTDTVYVGLLF
jgi:hypothetical protein